MSKHEGMVARIQAEGTAELRNLEQLKLELQEINDSVTTTKKIAQRAKASILADFYNGVERTLKIILSEVDGGLPKGDDWHRQLLANAKVATTIRSPVISEQLCNDLVPYLGFRHVVRNAYGFELDLDRVNKLAAQVPSVIDAFKKEVTSFLEKLPGIV